LKYLLVEFEVNIGDRIDNVYVYWLGQCGYPGHINS